MFANNLRIIFLIIVSASIITFIITFNSNNPKANKEGLTEDDVNILISAYIKENPQEIIDSLTQHQISKQRQDEEKAAKNIVEKTEELQNNPLDPIAGNPQGDVTVVEFFDYSCGYCKKIMPYIADILKNDPNVKVVFKELPILGPNSELASRASLAVYQVEPSKYFDYHSKLMSKRVTGEAALLKEASDLGIDADKVKAAMNSEKVNTALDGNRQLAESIGIRGTPAILIGDNFFPGAIDLNTFKKEIAKVRAGK